MIQQRADDQDMFWFPVMMGIVSRAEMGLADMAEVQLYNELAERKFKLMNGGGADE